MAEATQAKTNRDRLGERLKAKYPDREYADDEALFGQVNDDYDQSEGDLEKYRSNEKKLSDMMSKDHRSAAFLQGWMDGKDPAVQLMEMFGDEIVDAINDPEKMDEIAEARKKYLDRVAKEAENEKLWKDNLEASLKAIEEYQQQKGLSDEQVDQVMQKLIQIVNDAVVGKFEAETVDMISKALNYDADVQGAAAEGEVRGRNAKIEDKLRKPQTGDTMPQLAGRNNGAGGKRGAKSMFDIASEA